jgi:glyoxylase-like metal-dependent hydrolase (beta-lactamase superfamily II)
MTLSYATKLWSLDSPTITVDWSQMLVGGAGAVTIPVPAFLIEHPKGLVLFDTGLSPDAAGAPQSVYGELATAFDMQFSKEVTIENQLRIRGYSPEDVRYVVVSHLHFDHAGGLLQFPNATFFLGPGEFGNAHAPQAAGQAFYTGVDLGLAAKLRWLHIPYGEHDVYGDGSLVIYHTPGHTPGQLSLVVRLPNRRFVLTGDTAHAQSGLQQEIPNQYDYNTELAISSLQKLKLLGASNDATIWVSHDPDDWAKYGAPAEAYE